MSNAYKQAASRPGLHSLHEHCADKRSQALSKDITGDLPPREAAEDGQTDRDSGVDVTACPSATKMSWKHGEGELRQLTGDTTGHVDSSEDTDTP